MGWGRRGGGLRGGMLLFEVDVHLVSCVKWLEGLGVCGLNDR